MSEAVNFILNEQTVQANTDETIWQVAKRQGVEIPHLCYTPKPDYRPDGNCRACMVEIEGERVLAASCLRKPTEGMVVRSDTDKAIRSQTLVMELLVADQPRREVAHEKDSHLWQWAEKLNVSDEPFSEKGDTAGRCQPSGNACGAGCLYSMQSMRARLS